MIIERWPERWLIAAYALFIGMGSLIWPGLVWVGYLDGARFGIALFFLIGAITSVSGYLRYMIIERTVMALLILNLGKSFAFTLLGIAFLVLATFGSPQATAAWLLTVYALYGAAASTNFFTGLYLFFGANRGWISRDVFWLPWWDTRKILKGEEKKK